MRLPYRNKKVTLWVLFGIIVVTMFLFKFTELRPNCLFKLDPANDVAPQMVPFEVCTKCRVTHTPPSTHTHTHAHMLVWTYINLQFIYTRGHVFRSDSSWPGNDCNDKSNCGQKQASVKTEREREGERGGNRRFQRVERAEGEGG